MENKLKHCPFCGGKGSLESICILETEYSVQCESCGASGVYADKKKEAIEVWNRRTSNERDFV